MKERPDMASRLPDPPIDASLVHRLCVQRVHQLASTARLTQHALTVDDLVYRVGEVVHVICAPDARAA